MVQTKRLQMRGEPARMKCRLKSLRESRSATDPGRHGTGLLGWFSEERTMTQTHATPSLRARVVCALTYVLGKTNRSKNLKAKVPTINALRHIQAYLLVLIVRLLHLRGTRTAELRHAENKPSTHHRNGWATRFRLRAWRLENSPIAPPASLNWLDHLVRIRGDVCRPKGLEWARQSGGVRGQWLSRSHRGPDPSSYNPKLPSVEQHLGHQQRRYRQPTYDRGI
jgi:hypothetical protein